MKRALIWLFVSTIALCVACRAPIQNSSTNPACIKAYDPQADYFPQKVQIQYAKGFQVEYHKHYKVITVRSPWRDAKVQFRYALVQCGTPIPKGFDAKEVIQIPVQKIAVMSTTHLGHLEVLGLLDQLVAISDTKIAYGEEIQKRVQNQQVQDIGSNSNVNVEKLLELSPELITTYGTGNAATDSYPKLQEAGLKVAINAEYMELSPLGQTEWMKFTALFFNAESKVNGVFSDIVKQYQQVAELAKRAKMQPTVLTGFNRNGTWYVAGGKSHIAQMLKDAGASYLWKDDPTSGSTPLSFEAVYDRAINAEFWIGGSLSWHRLQDVKQSDDRYQSLKSLQSGKVYNNNARLNQNNGNDYWQSGIIRPHIVLSDLVKIFHPELLPNHQLTYYKRLR
ncbi:ABC transporter substrate-binding protein [Pseudanabaenaceae cyanobacterium LEGE 13415]|nr:ABC transporter substrate-binding protein [Pseudanabaenaceae cyanobacterium LEGE 13415]